MPATSNAVFANSGAAPAPSGFGDAGRPSNGLPRPAPQDHYADVFHGSPDYAQSGGGGSGSGVLYSTVDSNGVAAVAGPGGYAVLGNSRAAQPPQPGSTMYAQLSRAKSGDIIYSAGDGGAADPQPPSPDGAMYSTVSKKCLPDNTKNHHHHNDSATPVYQEAMEWRTDVRGGTTYSDAPRQFLCQANDSMYAQPASVIRGNIHAKLDEADSTA